MPSTIVCDKPRPLLAPPGPLSQPLSTIFQNYSVGGVRLRPEAEVTLQWINSTRDLELYHIQHYYYNPPPYRAYICASVASIFPFS